VAAARSPSESYHFHLSVYVSNSFGLLVSQNTLDLPSGRLSVLACPSGVVRLPFTSTNAI
jgi:hypothetical protein